MITATDTFHELAMGQVIQAVSKLYISFLKNKAENVEYFTLDNSILDGSDLLMSSEDNPIQLWDTYDYYNFTSRLVSMDIERSVEFPYGVQLAQADFTLDNTDEYFTKGSGSTIDDYNLPRRPLRVYGGFLGAEDLPQFVGLTQGMADIDTDNATATYHAVDFLSEIANQTLNNTIILRNVRTNVVLSKIVEQFGVLPEQYNFETGDNLISFVFFDKGQNAGEAIQQLVQAEGGKFWLDEMGILRFAKRSKANTEAVMSLPDYSIFEVKPSGENQIVNHIKINCLLREVQEFQTIYSKNGSSNDASGLWVVGANSTMTRECKLEDPCYSAIAPTIGKNSGVSWFVADNQGTEVLSGVSATGVLSTNAYTITFTNTNNYPVEITEMNIWGEPAKVYDEIDYDSYDDDSVAKYGEQVLEITDNPFFQSINQVQAFSNYILRERAEYNQVLELSVKGDFSLQLGDTIEIENEKHEGTYSIESIKWHLENGYYSYKIKCHKFEPVSYFVLDQSVLDGNDILA